MRLDVAFRVDAGIAIGTGHVMRCLTLADALRAQGARIRFVCRDMPGHMEARITERGYAATLLPPASGSAPPEPDPPPHAAWCLVSQDEDAAQTRKALSGRRPDWLVVDHYALDARWERAVSDASPRVMALDDLADRPHAVRLLLDQTLGRDACDYAKLAPHAEVLAGVRYALLRPDFASARPAARARRDAKDYSLRRMLIFMGGTDAWGVTAQALDALPSWPDLEVTVVMGGAAPTLDAVRARVTARVAAGGPTRLLIDTPNMTTEMAAADLAIGAGGTTSWERCVVGLPTLLVIVADNQAPSAYALAQAGAATVLGKAWVGLEADTSWTDILHARLTEFRADPPSLRAMAEAATAVCDGQGTVRVLRRLMAATVSLRAATIADSHAVWEWRHASNAAHFYHDGATPLPDHNAWFAQALRDPTRTLLIAERDGVPLGHLRLDRSENGEEAITVSIVMAPPSRGQGMARAVLEAGLAYADAPRAYARVHAANYASIRLFEGTGFQRAGAVDGFVDYVRL